MTRQELKLGQLRHKIPDSKHGEGVWLKISIPQEIKRSLLLDETN